MRLAANGRNLSLCVLVLMLVTCLVAFAGVDASYAVDATSPDYAHEFMGDKGWDNDVITQVDPNLSVTGADDLETSAGLFVGAGWDLLFTIDKFLVAIAIVLFAARVAGRGVWEMAFGGDGSEEGVPRFLRRKSVAVSASGNRRSANSSGGWFVPMCKDALIGLAVAAGVIVLLNVVAGLVLFGLGVLPPPNFSYFNL